MQYHPYAIGICAQILGLKQPFRIVIQYSRERLRFSSDIKASTYHHFALTKARLQSNLNIGWTSKRLNSRTRIFSDYLKKPQSSVKKIANCVCGGFPCAVRMKFSGGRQWTVGPRAQLSRAWLFGCLSGAKFAKYRLPDSKDDKWHM